MTYDDHSGMDFALRDMAAMQNGVAVLAAADGVVGAIRDGMPDRSVKDVSSGSVEGRECGNGVLLEHAGGWSTQYCHLRRGSVRVHRGEKLKAAHELGEIGLSGNTEYPHLHFVVRFHGKIVDPFLGKPGAACGSPPAPLWRDAQAALYAYAAGGVYNAGVARDRPTTEQARSGRLRDVRPAADDRRLYLWAEAFGVRAGDVVTFRLAAPGDRILIDRSERMERRRARIFRYVGYERRRAAWPSGLYAARIAVSDEAGQLLGERAWTFEIR
jgi:hypothetical protein